MMHVFMANPEGVNRIPFYFPKLHFEPLKDFQNVEKSPIPQIDI